jgi:hypothetical protein
MDKEILQKKLSDQREILNALDKEIVSAESELVSRQEAYSQSLLRQAGGQRASGLDAQLRRQTDAQTHLDGLRKARGRAEETLGALEKDLGLVDLFEQHAQGFHSAMTKCEQSIQTIEQSGSLNEHIKGLVGAIETIFKDLEAAVAGLSTVNKNLDGRYSLRAFLDGELLLQEDGQEDRDAFLEETGTHLKGFARASISVDLGAVQRLSELVELFPLWQAKINSFPTGQALVLSRHTLQPQKPKPARGPHPMGRPFTEDVERHPEKYSHRDVAWSKRVRGINPDEPAGGKIVTLGGR